MLGEDDEEVLMIGPHVRTRTARCPTESSTWTILTCALVLWLLLLGIVPGGGEAQAATMGPQSASYSPGSTSRVPIVLDLGTDQADRMGFSLEVIPGSGAPALTENLGFEQAAGLPAPMVTPTKTTISVAWLMTVSPLLTGTTTLGDVLVPIPSGASMSDTYTVHMLSAGASLGADEIPTTKGPDVTLGGPTGPPVITISITLQQLGVDVAPTTWDIGVIEPGTTQSTWVSGEEGYFAASNMGNVIEDFTISAGPTSPSGWTPGMGAAEIDQYLICFGIGEDPYTSEPAWICFDETPVTMDGPIGIAEYLPFDLLFRAPLLGSSGGENESFVIYLAASAH